MIGVDVCSNSKLKIVNLLLLAHAVREHATVLLLAIIAIRQSSANIDIDKDYSFLILVFASREGV